MRIDVRWIVVAGLALVPSARADDAPRGDLAKFQGAWSLVSMDRNGETVIPEGIESTRLVFEGDAYRLERDGEVLEGGTIRLDPEASPKQVDVSPSQGNDKGKTLRGIYAFDGQALRTCVAPPGEDRPGEFAAKAGTDHMLFTYKRAGR